jgi:hypothetical protein
MNQVHPRLSAESVWAWQPPHFAETNGSVPGQRQKLLIILACVTAPVRIDSKDVHHIVSWEVLFTGIDILVRFIGIEDPDQAECTSTVLRQALSFR